MLDTTGTRTQRSVESADTTTMRLASEVLRLRLSQLIINELYKAQKFKIPIHLALGHEAIAVALSAMMQPDDKLLLTHRNVAFNLARSDALRPLLDEYLLKPTGLAGGRYGSMNLLNPARGAVYTSSILGNQFPVAVGVAMGDALVARGQNIVIVLGGDGSMEEGSLYEAAVMARSLDLGVVFLLEDNQWSMATKIHERRRPIDLNAFATATGSRYERLEGNDVCDYLRKLQDLRASIVARPEPVILEVTVTTLGDWRGTITPEYPEGKFINYHAGPAPKVDLKEWPVIVESNEDPVFALLSRVSDEQLRSEAKRLFGSIQRELE